MLAYGMGFGGNKCGHIVTRGRMSGIHLTRDGTEPCVEFPCGAATSNPIRTLAVWVLSTGHWQWEVVHDVSVIHGTWVFLGSKIKQELRFTQWVCKRKRLILAMVRITCLMLAMRRNWETEKPAVAGNWIQDTWLKLPVLYHWATTMGRLTHTEWLPGV